MPDLYSYIIHHEGQPCMIDNKLVLNKCKPSLKAKKMNGIRYSAKENDWVIATLGKNYDKKQHKGSFFSEHGENARFFLVYAMKITEEPSDKKTKTKPIRSNYFFKPSKPMLLPERFQKVVSCGRHHKHLTSKNDGEMIIAFEKWIEEQKIITENELKITPFLCKKSHICV